MTSQTIFLAASSPLLTYHPYITSNTSADTSGWTAVEDGSTAQGPETTTGNAGLTYKTSGSNVSVELTYISGEHDLGRPRIEAEIGPFSSHFNHPLLYASDILSNTVLDR